MIEFDHKILEPSVAAATGCAAILTLVDVVARITMYVPVRTLNTVETARALYTRWYPLFGRPYCNAHGQCHHDIVCFRCNASFPKSSYVCAMLISLHQTTLPTMLWWNAATRSWRRWLMSPSPKAISTQLMTWICTVHRYLLPQSATWSTRTMGTLF